MEPQHQLLSEMMAPDQAEATLQWIRDVKKGLIHPPKNFNWFGMAEFSADNARNLNSMQWARVSLEVYEWPDWKIEWGWGSHAYVREAMSIRQQFIHSFGADREHDVLNPDKVQELFLQSLPAVSIEEALSIARIYREAVTINANRRPIGAYMKVRAICSGLRVVERLAEDGVALWPEVQQWMPVKGELCAVPPHNLKGRPLRRAGILKYLWLSLMRRW